MLTSNHLMNVVFINTTLESFTPTKSGAIGTWIWEMCQAAQRDGEDPLVITLSDDAEPYPWRNTLFLSYPRHDFNKGWKRILRKAFVLQAKYGGWYHMRHPAWARRVGDAIERSGKGGSTLILQNEPQLATVLRRRFPKAFILHLAQNQNTCSNRFRWRFRSSVDIAVAVSSFTARWNQEYFDIQVETLLSGVNTEKFHPAHTQPPGPPFIGFVGRTVYDKGPDLLLSAARKVAEKCKSFGVQILGNTHFSRNEWDSYQQELHDHSKMLEADGVTIRKPGFVDRNSLPAELRKTQIHVHPARWDEAFGLATLEGMATGLATVASRTGGTPEVVGDAGFLVCRDSVEELALRLAELVTNPVLRADYGLKARKRAELLTWNHTWQRLKSLLPS